MRSFYKEREAYQGGKMFASNETAQTTEALERLPSVLENESVPYGKRPRISKDKNTDILPSLTSEPPNAKVAWQQVAKLRKENMHLRALVEGQRTEMKRVLSEHQQLQTELEESVEANQSREQELANYQAQLQELEERYQTLETSFQDTVEGEAHKLMQEAAETALQSPDDASPLVQDVVKTVKLHLKKEEDKHLIEALCLKREVQRMADFLEQEHKQLQQEREQLISFQASVREQESLRQKLHKERLSTHQKVISLLTSLALLALFIVLEFVFLALFHTPFAGPVAWSIIIPIVVCLLLRIALATPINTLKLIYKSAPHKRPVNVQA
jgi:Fe2+ transport system protein B